MEEYALTNGRIFLDDRLHDGLALHVSGERIAAVCEQAALPAHVRQVDAGGRAIVPGLIDVHVHSEEWHAPLFLANGVTTVRDVGCELNTILDRRERWNQPDAAAPRMVCCGPLLEGGGAAHTKTMLVVKTPSEGRDAVDMLVESGVDQIKLYAWLEWPTFKAILEQSQKYNKFTVAHMMNYVDARSAVEAGLNEIEHCSGCAEAFYPERGLSGELWRKLFPDQTRDQMNRLIDLLLQRGTWMAVTRVIWHKIAHEWDPRHWTENSPFSVPPRAGREATGRRTENSPFSAPPRAWREAPSRQTAHPTFSAPPPSWREAPSQRDHPQLRYASKPLQDWWLTRRPLEFSREYRFDWARAEGAMQIFIATLIERGARIIAGSDAPFVHVLPGFGLHEELQLLLDCGMTPAEAILAATRLAAEAIQLDAQVGSLAQGKYADCVIVDGDPTMDIRALRSIWRVMRGGTLLETAPLLAQAEQYAQTAQPNVIKRFSELY